MNNNYMNKIEIIPATLSDYTTIQNLARFYVYDRTKFMRWECPENGLFECIDFKHYFDKAGKKAFLIRINKELAGFFLLDKMKLLQPVDWNMGEFFVLAKFQGSGAAESIALQIFKDYPGIWSIAVMPNNIKAVKFWRKIISHFTNGNYSESFKTEDELKSEENSDPYDMIIFIFDSKSKNQVTQENYIIDQVSGTTAESVCRKIISTMPEYFGISEANEQYAAGVHSCQNFAARIDEEYIGLISIDFPYPKSCNIYWMAVLHLYQGRGIGHRMIEAARIYSKERGATTMTVETLAPIESDENYLKTYNFYRSSGFSPLLNIKPEGYEWNMVYMAKTISSNGNI